MLNSLVHVIMYSYYLLSSLGPWIQPYLWWKRYLTQFQIVSIISDLTYVTFLSYTYPLLQVQFALIAAHISVGIYNRCDFPVVLCYAVAIYCVTLIGFFANFYVQAYIRKSNKKRN